VQAPFWLANKFVTGTNGRGRSADRSTRTQWLPSIGFKTEAQVYRQLASQAELSRAEFDAARLGFFQTLRRKRMSPQFVERHGEDLFAQACFEYSRRVSEGEEIANPPAWIVTCGWHRTVGLLETRDWRPRMVSTESIAEPIDDEEATPEATFLAEDRGRKVREAVEELPAYQRKLLALSYFEGVSVREAGRRLHWTASKAQRAHEAAQKRIHELLGVESTDDLQIEIGLFAFLSVAADHAAGHALPAGFEAVLDSAHHGVVHLGEGVGKALNIPSEIQASVPDRALQKLVIASSGKRRDGRGPLRRITDLAQRLVNGRTAEAGVLASGEGAGRALEFCKGIAICVVGSGALTGALVGGGHHPHQSASAAHHAPVARVAHVHRDPAPHSNAPAIAVVPTAPESRSSSESKSSSPKTAGSSGSTEIASRVEAAASPSGSGAAPGEKQEAEAVEQFGDIASTEGASAETKPASSSGTTFEEKKTSQAPVSSGGEPDPERRAEEAGAAKEFHGLLE
jgi:RNA polymerase sigma factor (sigma-70 family)